MAVKSRGFTTLFLTTLLSGTVCLVPNSALARGGGGSSYSSGSRSSSYSSGSRSSSYSSGSRSSSYSSGSHGRSVHVSGYTRHDGTYVPSYTRSAPTSGSRYSRSLGYSTGSEYSGSSGYSTGSEYSGSSSYSGSSNDSNPNSTTSDTFQDAINSAISATTIAQSAVSKDDWELVSSKLLNSINLLKEVPASSPNYAEVQVKIQEYEASLNYAQQQLGLPPLIQSEEVTTQTTFNGELQPNEESSVSVAPDISPTVPSQDSIVTDSVSPSPEVTLTTSTTSPEVTPDSESNPLGAIILTVLVALVAIGFYKAKTTKPSGQVIEDKAKDFFNQGLAKSQGRNLEAIGDFTQAILLNPNYAEAYFMRGSNQLVLKFYQDAIQDYNRAIQLKTDYGQAYYERGMARGALSDYQGAVEDYSQAIKLNVKYDSLYNNRGAAYQQLGLYKEALNDFNQAIKLNSNDALYYKNRGIIRRKLRDEQGATIDFNMAEKLSALPTLPNSQSFSATMTISA